MTALTRTLQRRHLTGLTFAMPALLAFLAFAIWPTIRVFYLSLFEYSLMTPPEWVGFANFGYLLGSDAFREVAVNSTFYVSATYIPAIGIALLLALALTRPMRAGGALRLIYFSPVAMSWVTVAMMWRIVLQPNGMLNQLLGIDVDWLTSFTMARWGLVIMSVWKEMGFFLILFLAALAAVPRELIEAATVDGANALRRFRHIILPSIKPITAVCCVMAVIRGAQAFSAQYVMTGGGFGTEVINLYVYKTAFESARMGRASAVAVLMFFVLLAVTLIQLRVFRKNH